MPKSEHGPNGNIFQYGNNDLQLETINGVLFTNREIDIVACILSGKGAKKIASFLLISPKTVENHIRNIMLKLSCRTQENGVVQKVPIFMNSLHEQFSQKMSGF